MTTQSMCAAPRVSGEQRRIAAGRFERARQVIAMGDDDYDIQLLLTCCKLDPTTLVYRHLLRHTQKAKHHNNQRGSRLAFVRNSPRKARLHSAIGSGDFLKVLEWGEQVVVHNPWAPVTQMQMAEAVDALGLLDLAVWLLEQARQRDSQQVALNRALARLYEKRGNFARAITLWEMIRKVVPQDVEARHKGKDLSARETISRGRYEESAKPSTNESEKDTEQFTASDGTAIAPPPDRVSREAAPLLARIAKAPAEPVPYLQLATVYSRAGQDDQAHDILNKGLQAPGEHFQILIAIMERDLTALRGELAITEKSLRRLPPLAESETEEETELGSLHRRQTNEIAEREIALWRLNADHHPNHMSHRVELGIRLLPARQVDAPIVQLQIAKREKPQQRR